VSSTDLAAALDDARSRSSSVALAEELAEKNRIIERLQARARCARCPLLCWGPSLLLFAPCPLPV
jgi:hypothetical protein